MMKRMLLSGLILLLLVQPIFAQTKEQVFEKVWKAVGGKATFEKSRYLQFTFASERDGQLGTGRNHIWDSYTGDYRFESKATNGKTTIVLFNVNTQQGKAYEDGILLADTTSAKLVKRGYAAFINDTYWLMVPVKLQDPGVNTFLEPEETINEVKCQVMRLNFDKVGLTPGDQYWLYVDDKTGEIIKWKFLLQGQTNTSAFDWSPYVDLGNGLKLSTKKLNKEGKFAIVFPVAKVLSTLEKDTFLKP